MDERRSFGIVLRRYRVRAGLTQEQLAEQAGLSARAITDLERGVRRFPYLDTIVRLSEALALGEAERAELRAAGRRPGAPLISDGGLKGIDAQLPASPGAFMAAVPPGRLVARERELAGLLAAMDAAASGQGGLIMLCGEPGVGKTRLAQEVLIRSVERGNRALVWRCYEEYMSLPYQPFRQAILAWFASGLAPTSEQAMRRWPDLAQLLPELTDGPSAEGHDREAQLRLLEAVRGLFAAIASTTPLCLLLDDLHWADSASVDLLLSLTRHLRGSSVLMLGTYRDSDIGLRHPLTTTLGKLVHERVVEEMTLREFSPAGTSALVRARLSDVDGADQLAEVVHGRAEGNPFFSEEVLRALVEQGVLNQTDGQWHYRAAVEITVPRTVRQVIAERVARLGDQAQQLLRIASVLGQEFDLDLLVATSGEPEPIVGDALDAAVLARLLEIREVGPYQMRYAFAHALIQQTLYAEHPPHRLQRLHRQAGEVLERLHGNEPRAATELARHFLAARDSSGTKHREC